MQVALPNADVDDDLAATLIACQNSATPVDSRQANEADPSMPDIGTVLLHRWRLQAWAGLGTASVVFRGQHLELPLPVAIKIVSRQHYRDRETAVGHLRNEAHVLTRLRHPNIARLWDFQEEGEFPCLVTDFIDGTTLRQLIRVDGRVEPRRIVRMALQIADVLAESWREGFVHRDIKPENIVLCVDGTAKLIDFGLATMMGSENLGVHAIASSPPRVGTVAYLAPEQARNSAAVDQRADMYSFGATLYHAVTGRLPFAGNNAAQVILRHIEDVPAPPTAFAPNLNATLSAVILRMMAKSPKDRFANASEFRSALEDVQESLR